MNLKQTALYTIVIIIITAGITRYAFPVIQEKLKIQEKEVVRNDVRTIIKEVVRPDGSKETVTEIVDRTRQEVRRELEKTVSKQHDWLVTVGASSQLLNFIPVYELAANRRILGPFYVGGSVRTDKEIGIKLGMEF